MVGYSYGGHPELPGFFDEVLYSNGPVEQAELTVDMEVYK